MLSPAKIQFLTTLKQDSSPTLTCPSESTCHAVKQGVHSRCPQGSILISLSFSAQILHSWNVLPVLESTKPSTRQSVNSTLRGTWFESYPSHSRVRTAPASPWCDPPGDSARQTIGPGSAPSRLGTDRSLPCCCCFSMIATIKIGFRKRGNHRTWKLTYDHLVKLDIMTCFGELFGGCRRPPLRNLSPTDLVVCRIICAGRKPISDIEIWFDEEGPYLKT